MKKYVLIYFLFLSLISYGQIFNPNLNPIPVSPNSASLGKYGAIPMSLYNGTATIPISIYDIDLDGKKIPVSLSYNTSGIKVAQEATSVGLGWTLNAGGCITRMIRSKDDLATYGYYYGNHFPEGNNDPYDLIIGDPLGWNDQNTNPAGWEIFQQYVNGVFDSEPDIFYYNFGSYSGEFHLDESFTAGTYGQEKAVIFQNPTEYLTATDVSLTSWTLYDAQGYQYIFSVLEETKSYSKTDRDAYVDPIGMTRNMVTGSTGDNVITAWYLTSIKSPQGNIVKFTYDYDYIYTPISFAEDSAYPITDKAYDAYIKPYKYYSYSYSTIKQPRISKITFNGGAISFNTSDRLDLASSRQSEGHIPQKINNIQISDTNKKIIKDVNLDYSYLGNSGNPLTCRLMLDKIYEQHGSDEYAHSFTYNRSNFPSKQSIATDLWGYYNSSTDPGTGAEFRSLPGVQLSYMNKVLKGRNKKSSLPDTSSGILTSIKYPTGGKTDFTYELNSYEVNQYNPGYTNVIIVRDVVASFDHEIFANQNTFFVIGEPFEIPKDSAGVKYMGWSLENTGMSEPEEEGSVRGSFTIAAYIEKQENGVWSHYRTCVSQMYKYSDTNLFDEIERVTLKTGVYRFCLRHSMYLKDNERFNFSASLYEYKAISTNVSSDGKIRESGNGLRIKEISTTVDGKQERKYYDYNDDSRYTTGRIKAEPVFFGNSTFVVSNPQGHGTATPTTVFIGDFLLGRSSQMYSVSSNTIGYSRVKEYQEGNGYTTYKYINWGNTFELDLQSNFVPGAPSIPNYLDGSLSEVEVYDQDSILKRRTKYSYMELDDKYIGRGLKIYTPTLKKEYPQYDVRTNYTFYYRLIKKFFLEKENTYIFSGTNSVEEEKIYEYDSKYFVNTEISTKGSNGNIYKQLIKYPFNYSETITNKMKAKNMLSYPLETISLMNSTVTNATKINYKDTLGIIVPSKTYVLERPSLLNINNYSTNYIPDHSLTKNDSKGRVNEVRDDKSGALTVYLWSYNGQYPVAEIKNADYATVNSALATVGLTSVDALSANTNPDKAKLDKLRTVATLSGAMITTYKYQPLVGILEATSPTGVTTHYEYDLFGRLQSTYIEENGGKKKLQEYNYHYKNQ